MMAGTRSTPRAANGLYKGMSGGGSRPAAVGLAKILFLAASQIGAVAGAPLREYMGITGHGGGEVAPKEPSDPELWIYLTIAMVLVLSGGAFAGLTIALMGQDGIYLQVIATSGEGAEQKHAKRVFRLLARGKHWVLVTLLLANVIVNETLPIILDRSLGGGWPAVLGSTALIVIFGEVIPQSICVRYGLQIGAFMAPYVLVLMYLLAPIAWPTAKLLDYLLGEDHGTVYKKSGLKTLVTLHKTLGTSPSDRLNQDEVTIISAVLDLKDKPVGDIMTPMQDVFTMSADTVLDEKTMDNILSAGYSRIPIYEPGNENNFIGMLLVKILITYDPEDCKKVGEFALATLPETRPETSCLDIVNFFQEGKSHMVLVSEFPGEDHGATGVVTLEDVIEELIGECVSPTQSLIDFKNPPHEQKLIPQRREIIDESDVYIDVHKAIRRLAPAPTYKRAPKGQIVEPTDPAALKPNQTLIDFSDDSGNNKSGESAGNGDAVSKIRKASLDETRRHSYSQNSHLLSSSPKANFMLRRGSSAAGDSGHNIVRGNANDMREHLKHLGPSNLASRPKQTRYATVKIKPGHIAGSALDSGSKVRNSSISEEPYRDEPSTPARPMSAHAAQGGEGEGLLSNAARDASDGVLAIHQGYGSMDRKSGTSPPDVSNKAQQVNFDGASEALRNKDNNVENPFLDVPGKKEDSGSDTVGSLKSGQSSPNQGLRKKRGTARSGSITENIVDMNGVRKVVLQTTSSSDEEREAADKKRDEEGGSENEDEGDKENGRHSVDGGSSVRSSGGKKKRKSKKKKGKKTTDSGAGPSGR